MRQLSVAVKQLEEEGGAAEAKVKIEREGEEEAARFCTSVYHCARASTLGQSIAPSGSIGVTMVGKHPSGSLTDMSAASTTGRWGGGGG